MFLPNLLNVLVQIANRMGLQKEKENKTIPALMNETAVDDSSQ
jgi:hypothetical protein